MRIKAVIFDLGGVFFTWQGATHKCLQTSLVNMKQIHSHPIWHDFEIGRINQESLYTQLFSEIGFSRKSIETSIEDVFQTLEMNQAVAEFSRIQKELGRTIICLSNIPKPYFSSLFKKFNLENIFERIYLAFLLGFGKPSHKLFEYLLQQEDLLPEEIVLIDDDADNIRAAIELGIHTIRYKAGCDLVKEMNRIEELISLSRTKNKFTFESNISSKTEIFYERARTYLETSLRRDGFCRSFISQNTIMEDPKEFSQEIFSTLLILDISKSLSNHTRQLLLDKVCEMEKAGAFSFFLQKSPDYFEPDKDYFPDDVDTTSLAYSLLLAHGRATHKYLVPATKKILNNSNAQGIIQVYFDRDRPRLDPIVCINALNFLFLMDVKSHSVINSTKQYILDFLCKDKWQDGTRYYSSPDAFLYFLSRLVSRYPKYMEEFKPHLLTALAKRANFSDEPIEQAIRVISGHYLGLKNRLDYLKLLDHQLSDGGWPMNSLFIAPKSQHKFGSRELTTAFALEAIGVMATNSLKKHLHS